MFTFIKNILKKAIIDPGKETVKCPFCCNTFEAKDYLFRCEGYIYGQHNPDATQNLDSTRDPNVSSNQFVPNDGDSNEFTPNSGDLSLNFENSNSNSNSDSSNSRGRKWCNPQKDETMERIWGESAPMGRIVIPTQDTAKGTMFVGHLDHYKCDKCGYDCTVKVCPHCHHSFSGTTIHDDTFVISFIGAKNSGKSNYITVLLYKILKSGLGDDIALDFQMANDMTRSKAADEYLRPYTDQAAVDSTKAVGVSKAIKEPLVFSVGIKRKSFFGETITTNKFSLVIFDVAGEDLTNPYALDIDLQHILKSDAYIFLVDPMELKVVTDMLNAKSPEGGVDLRISMMLDSLTQRITKKNKILKWYKINKPVAVVMSKMDKIERLIVNYHNLRHTHTHHQGFDTQDFEVLNNEARFLFEQVNCKDICDKISTRFSKVAFFGVSALGADPVFDENNRQKIESLNPRRLEDPFLWLLYKNKRLKASPPPKV
jgi:GTP-binding protein EngB required for normal cell division